MQIIENEGITAPSGYLAQGAHIGVKAGSGNLDYAVVLSQAPATWAGVFTQNKACAAPVLWDRKLLEKGGSARAIVINSGNANAATGAKGQENAKTTATEFAKAYTLDENEVLLCSTGVIGVQLPIAAITKGIQSQALKEGNSRQHALDAATAICTTDTYPKEKAVSFPIEGKTVTIGGMAKGSGMIHPNMATMLCFITTDAQISRQLLQKALHTAVDRTLNRVSVDGDTSTNDTCLLLANGFAQNTPIDIEDENYTLFVTALTTVCEFLAKDIARDGEGATKLMTVTVDGAKTEKDAAKIARSITSSTLFKAALFGRDANWGRVLCAMGYSGADFDIEAVHLEFASTAGAITLMENGAPIVFDEEKALRILTEAEININVKLFDGSAKATAWGCDLTYDYVKINGEYRS